MQRRFVNPLLIDHCISLLNTNDYFVFIFLLYIELKTENDYKASKSILIVY